MQNRRNNNPKVPIYSFTFHDAMLFDEKTDKAQRFGIEGEKIYAFLHN